MESHKDVILSQAPAMYERTGKGAGVLENYKGILLCARPANLPHGPSMQLRGETVVGGTLSTVGGEAAPAFVPSGATETQAGLGPSVEDRAIMERNRRRRLENYKQQRVTARSVLTRHRRWLRSFAEEVRRMKKDEIQHEVELARRAGQFSQQQAQKRVEVAAGGFHQTADATPTIREPKPQEERVSTDAEQAAIGKKKKAAAKKKQKPKWALTEDEALEDELADADELLEFAKNLDYEKFISDYEVAGALAIMRERVEEIARENNWSKETVERAASESVDEEFGEDEAEAGRDDTTSRTGAPRGELHAPKQGINAAMARKAAPRHAVKHTEGWDKSTSIGGVLKRAIFRDTLLLAERILASSASMQKIHTKYSLARVLQKCVLTGTDATEAMQKPSIGGSRGLDGGPRIVKVQPDATGLEPGEENTDVGSQRTLLAMQRSKERTQGLPYLYRCPAI
ncbi:hypothetical protein TraAM80_02936 [Trypanosoma rangeli]|uniref:Uncharacterized protein n=1 Tax=Trypanosoma rangeli TaxID=5698 RepID=A0A3R7NLS4_TRYRA|nr:uncharacterized protein TraAM80_02936 [Trypanosoma rangeli]RNF08345.1 hypothetical protein TraAM80_02936 [Trypanosoma rangeli]|eukprot:RNF08345.1 hypothetical protein TraAM80_02936 [Trypanosoma rangeli]